jgi:hypothetical protein
MRVVTVDTVPVRYRFMDHLTFSRIIVTLKAQGATLLYQHQPLVIAVRLMAILAGIILDCRVNHFFSPNLPDPLLVAFGALISGEGRTYQGKENGHGE